MAVCKSSHAPHPICCIASESGTDDLLISKPTGGHTDRNFQRVDIKINMHNPDSMYFFYTKLEEPCSNLCLLII